MSQQYIAGIVALVSFLLPKLVSTVGQDQISNLIAGIITVVSIGWAMYRRYKQGDITLTGSRIG